MGTDRLDMTLDQWKIFRRLTERLPGDKVDTEKLRRNLRLSPLERLRRLEREIRLLRPRA